MSKGNSSSKQESKTNVTNQQVATESGIAVGANSSAQISITTSDAETTRNALQANVLTSAKALDTVTNSNALALGANAAVTHDALNFAGHAADVAADTNKFATRAVEDIAGNSILAQNNLATKFGQNVSDLAAQNINLLQSVGQQQSDVALKSLDTAKSALDQSFGVSRATAPQDANFTQTETSKYMLYAVVAIAALFALGAIFFRKRA